MVKDKLWHLKRLSRSMLVEWKKFDRIVKEQHRRAEKEAEEQRKMDKEILEVGHKLIGLLLYYAVSYL